VANLFLVSLQSTKTAFNEVNTAKQCHSMWHWWIILSSKQHSTL